MALNNFLSTSSHFSFTFEVFSRTFERSKVHANSFIFERPLAASFPAPVYFCCQIQTKHGKRVSKMKICLALTPYLWGISRYETFFRILVTFLTLYFNMGRILLPRENIRNQIRRGVIVERIAGMMQSKRTCFISIRTITDGFMFVFFIMGLE